MTGLAVMAAMMVLSACGSGSSTDEDAAVAAETADPAAAPVTTAGRLLLAVNGASTAPDGKRCVLDVTAANDTGHEALNVQAAWTAHTEGFGIISDYQRLGDFAAGEQRALSG